MAEYTAEQFRAAAQRALAAGDSATAKKLIQRGMALSPVPQQDPQNEDGTYGQPPEGMFLDPSTGSYTSRELMKGNIEPSQGAAAAGGLGQGYSLGTMDELAGAVGYVKGGPNQANADREFARAKLEKNAEEFPKTNLAAEITGAVTSPVTKLLPQVSTARGAAVTGGTVAAIDGFNRGEGGITDRLEGAGKSAATGLFFAGMTSAATKSLGAGFRQLTQRAEKRPSIEALKGVKNAAYKAVRKSGEKFSGDDMQALAQRVARKAKIADIDPTADPQTTAALKMFNNRSGEEVSLNRLDRIRQNLWSRYNRSDEPAILDMIGEIDKTIASKGDSSELMAVARLANSKYAKAELLENAFKKAELQTAATGSGGNILNKYRQAVTSILTKPHEAKWFSADELKVMEAFVRGDGAENVLRRVGKLAPGGNGLMTALNVYAATVDPAMLAVTAAASGAKMAADRSAMKGSEALLDAVSTGVIRKPPPAIPLKGVAVGSAIGGNELRRD